MTQKYKFKVTSKISESYLPEIEEKFCIRVSEENFNPTSFLFFLKLKEGEKAMETRNITLKVGVAWQDMEKIAYLKGKFDFDSERSINLALLELKKSSNRERYCLDEFSSSWQELHIQFSTWYNNEFRHYLDNEAKSNDILLNLKTESE